MRVLEPRMIQEYKCEYCGKKYRKEVSCKVHEDKCFSNPNRNCPTCGNTGTEFYLSGSANLGVEEVDRDCSSCKIALSCGGKSYIDI